jgi:uncharacterized damage-inducible protein DinB
MNAHLLLDLYQHMEWADAKVWTATFDAENGRTDEKLRAIFHHIHLVQYAFLHMWRKEPGELNIPELPEAHELMRWGQNHYDDLYGYIKSLNEDALSAEPTLPEFWVNMIEKQLGQNPEKATLKETVVQVALHTMHHRGQISMRLRELGSEPPTIDYITWVWLGRPATCWPTDIS